MASARLAESTRMRLAITGYNRLEYMRETISAWANVRGIQDITTEFHLEPGYPDVEAACCEAPFPSEVHVADTHLGIRMNPWKAADHAFQHDDFVILGEDDMIVGADTLEYFSWAKDQFRDDSRILAVSAAQGIASDPPSEDAVSARTWFSAWVWGLWRDRWDMISSSWHDGEDHRGWDYLINFGWCQTRGYQTVIPHLSRVQHIGKTGTYCNPGIFDSLLSTCFTPDVTPQHYRVIS